MRSFPIAVAFLALLAPVARAGEAADGRPDLDGIRKRHCAPRAAGLAGFKATLALEDRTDPEMKEAKKPIAFASARMEPGRRRGCAQRPERAGGDAARAPDPRHLDASRPMA